MKVSPGSLRLKLQRLQILRTKKFDFPNASANELTQAALDPVAKIPEYKITAVKIELVN